MISSKQPGDEMTNELYLAIPEFKVYALEHIDVEFLGNNYLVFGPFGGLLTDWIIEDASNELIDRCYDHINQLCKNADKETEQMLKVTFFEHLTDFKKSIAMSRLKLHGEALTFFEEVLNGPIFSGGKYAK